MIKKNELVYICSPLSAPTEQQIRENMKKASDYAELVVRQFHCRAIAPHSFLPAYLDDRDPRRKRGSLPCIRHIRAEAVQGGDRLREPHQQRDGRRDKDSTGLQYPGIQSLGTPGRDCPGKDRGKEEDR